MMFEAVCFVMILTTNSFVNFKGRVMQLFNNKHIIASTQIKKTEIFTFITVLVPRLLHGKVLFINRKDDRNC